MQISTLSALHGRPVVDWERYLESLDSGQALIPAWYKPMTQACVAAARGSARSSTVLESGLASLPTRPQTPSIVMTSRAAFAHFTTHVVPKLGKFERSLLSDRQLSTWNGYELTGQVHFECQATRATPRYCSVLASAWSAEQLKAHVELLSILCEVRYGASRSEVGLFDLRNGHLHRPGSSYVRLRNQLEKTMRHLQRLLIVRSRDAA